MKLSEDRVRHRRSHHPKGCSVRRKSRCEKQREAKGEARGLVDWAARRQSAGTLPGRDEQSHPARESFESARHTCTPQRASHSTRSRGSDVPRSRIRGARDPLASRSSSSIGSRSPRSRRAPASSPSSRSARMLRCLTALRSSEPASSCAPGRSSKYEEGVRAE